MLINEHSDLAKVLFSNNKLIENKNNIEKNISEGLLTFRTLVITTSAGNETEALGQLEKILIACKLQNTDYSIFTLTNDWSFYRNNASIKEVLLFGITEADLNINIQLPYNQPVKFDERTWIKTASITEVMESRDLKNILWQNALKPHFVG